MTGGSSGSAPANGRVSGGAHRARDVAERAGRTVLRGVPAPLLLGVARRGGRLRSVAARGIEERAVPIAAGRAAGLSIDIGRTNVDHVLGSYELPVQDALVALCRPGSVVYDVGANIGFFSLVVARAVGPRGAVYAFEADLDNAARLRRNAAANGFDTITVVARAVGTTTGVGSLSISDYEAGHALSDEGDDPGTIIGRAPVETLALDDFVQGRGVRPPDVVKIDVEGAEPAVLAGMAGVIAEHAPALVLEVDAGSLGEVERKRAALEHQLTDLGYEVTLLADSYPSIPWFVRHVVATHPRRSSPASA